MDVRHSAEIGELAGALALAQLEFKPVLKESDNPFYKSKYADLSSVISATQSALAKNGLVVIQCPHLSSQQMTLTTLLVHKSGQWLASDLTLPAVMKERFDAQSVGSSITYARRYAYQAIVGVAAEVDDDANAAVGIGSKEAQQKVLKDKLAGAGKEIPSLFYVWFDESQTAEIKGDRALMEANADVLKPLKLGSKLVANLEQLEGLKYTFDQRGVLFKPLKAT